MRPRVALFLAAFALAACSVPPSTPGSPAVVVLAPLPASSVAPPRAPPEASPVAIDLPTSREPPSKLPLLVVDLMADGSMSIDGKPVEDVDVRAEARRALAKSTEIRAVVRADKAAVYGRVVHLIDVLHQAGIARIALAVAPVP
jgi:biopolymer transport protein ExbD